MKKRISLLVTAVLLIICALSFAACFGGDGNTDPLSPAATHTVTFDSQDGGDVAQKTGVSENTAISAPSPAPAKNGYNLSGWFKDAAGNTEWNFIADKVMGDITLYAKWTAVEYTVTYENLLNGTNPNTVTKYTIESPSITFSSPARTGYTGNWDITGIPSGSTGNKTITAVWTAIEYDIIYVLGDAKNHTDNPSKYTIESSITLQDPSRDGYTFNGWNDGAVIAAGNTGNKTVTAKWIVKQYDLAVSNDNDTAGTVSTGGTYDYDTSITITATAKSGYTFLGWHDGDTLLSENASYTFNMPAGNKTYTAKWGDFSLTRTAGTIGGSVLGSVGRIEKDSSCTVTAATDSGYTFLGWFDADNETLESMSLSYTFKMPPNNKTLTAKWMPCAITLVRNITEAGTVSGADKTIINDETTITADSVHWRYKWIGWFDGETKVSMGDSSSYTFTMTADNKTFTAKWEIVTGTQEDPFIIYNATQLTAFAASVNGGNRFTGSYVCLGGNINLNYEQWTPIGNSGTNNFAGTFNGGGYEISNFWIPAFHQRIGLFGNNTGTIKNLGVRGVAINVSSSSHDAYMGGLVGYNNGTIADCYAIGYMTLAISYSTETSVDDKIYAGGLVGYNSNTITGCYGNVNVSATAAVSKNMATSTVYAGGLAGYNNHTIADCYADGSVSASAAVSTNTATSTVYAGGLVGYNNNKVTHCYGTGTVSAAANATAQYVLATSTANAYAGGLAGYNFDTVTECYATGKVSANASSAKESTVNRAWAGGLIGYNTTAATINKSYATGIVSVSAYRSYAGGLNGGSYGTITNCYATGNVDATRTSTYSTAYLPYAGGLVGINNGTIFNCYARGAASIPSIEGYAGGLAGYNANNSVIQNCYATGDVMISSGYGYVGGLVAENGNGMITNCYRYSGQTIKQGGVISSDNTLGTILEIEQFNKEDFYIVTLGWNADGDIWDFTNLDFSNRNYPTLLVFAKG